MATDALQYIFGLSSAPSSPQDSSQGGAAGLKDARLNLQRTLLSLSAEQCAVLDHARTIGLDLNRLVRKVAVATMVDQATSSDENIKMSNDANNQVSGVKAAAIASVDGAQSPAAVIETTLFWDPECADCCDLNEKRGDRGKLCPLGYAPLPTSSAVTAAGRGSSSGNDAGLMSMSWAEVLESCEPGRAASGGEERRGQSCCVRVDPWLLARVRASLLQQ